VYHDLINMLQYVGESCSTPMC